uniref:Soluble scavenger receptor cysteine-rich domain-containing protein SSC5D n=1 Tax=Varanus komodoensis TaxID=61221 RepID=A0A8D2LII5_VARKO
PGSDSRRELARSLTILHVLLSSLSYDYIAALPNSDSSRHGAGRVEVCCKWGTVCDAGWHLRDDAHVACRELSCGNASKALGGAHFGQGSGPIWMEGVNCTGEEAFLRDCPQGPWGQHSCDHSQDASVECSGRNLWVRLVNGRSRCSGRIEVFHNQENAQVVCRELACGGALAAHQKAHFGIRKGPIWLPDVICEGTEAFLKQCPTNHQETHCYHNNAAGVVCSGNVSVRLASSSSRCAGRVEVFHNNEWGTICNTGWDLQDAQVVCQELGCGNVSRIVGAAKYGEGSGPIWLHSVNCTGGEAALSECAKGPQAQQSCSHSQDASVDCTGESCGEKNVSKLLKFTQIFGGNVYMLWGLQVAQWFKLLCCWAGLSLVNGRSRCSGRVEVLRSQQWGTACDDGWDMIIARVVCRQLGCGEALSAPGKAHFGRGHGPIWLVGVTCDGTEDDLNHCPVNTWSGHKCYHSEDAGVVCSELRLVNGSSRCAGQIEVLHDHQWGTICDSGWDLHDAHVVCRELNCGNALQAFGAAWFVNCTGSEATLSECPKTSWGEHRCDHRQDAGVECSGNLSQFHTLLYPTEIRLVNGSSPCSGRIEVFHDGQWGTVCDDSWDRKEAQVLCRQLGCGEVLSAPKDSYFGRGLGPIWLDDLNCTWLEDSISKCPRKPWGQHDCSHYQDAGIVCSGNELGLVVCRELGCGNASKALETPWFPERSSPIWLESVNCTGREASLRDCPKKLTSPFRVSGPTHVRLMDGPNRCSGRVEVFGDQQWEALCDLTWSLDNAQVLCRQLGCGIVSSNAVGVHFGKGHTWISKRCFSCWGTEDFLFDCVQSGVHPCSDENVAGVVCSGKQNAKTPRKVCTPLLWSHIGFPNRLREAAWAFKGACESNIHSAAVGELLRWPAQRGQWIHLVSRGLKLFPA